MTARWSLVRHAVAIAAALFAAAPAFAQTNDPGLTQSERDCLNRGDADCADAPTADETGGQTTEAGQEASSAVVLPDLIVDLFPNPAGHPVPTPNPLRPADSALPPPAGAVADQAAPPSPNPPSAAPDIQPVAPGDLASTPAQGVAGDFVPDEVLVTVPGDPAVVPQIAATFGLEVRSQRQSALLGATLVRYGIPDGRPVGVVLAQLAADGRTQRREPNHVYTLQQVAAAPSYAFERIALDAGAANGQGVRVAVIDTAIEDRHPALKGVIAGQFDAMPDVKVEARDHGTSVDGLIAGIGSFRGMAPGAQIFHARAFEGGRSTMDIILSALDWVAEQDVRIINMSFVGPKNGLMGTACENARGLGIVLIAAAGNNGPRAPYGYPAAFDGVIAVTATDSKDGLMPQANRGPYVYISAPGVDVVAPIGGGQDMVTGTSFAAAVVSGAVANLFHADPGLSADRLEKALAVTAKDLGPKGRDKDFGFGLIDIKAAEAAKE